jgi:hypothetical protein
VSERVERALELYRLCYNDDQSTDSRLAELRRMMDEFEPRERIAYYKRVRPLVLKQPMSVLLKIAAEDTEWTYEYSDDW